MNKNMRKQQEMKILDSVMKDKKCRKENAIKQRNCLGLVPTFILNFIRFIAWMGVVVFKESKRGEE